MHFVFSLGDWNTRTRSAHFRRRLSLGASDAWDFYGLYEVQYAAACGRYSFDPAFAFDGCDHAVSPLETFLSGEITVNSISPLMYLGGNNHKGT